MDNSLLLIHFRCIEIDPEMVFMQSQSNAPIWKMTTKMNKSLCFFSIYMHGFV